MGRFFTKETTGLFSEVRFDVDTQTSIVDEGLTAVFQVQEHDVLESNREK